MYQNERDYLEFEALLLGDLTEQYEIMRTEELRKGILELRIRARNLWKDAGHERPLLGFEKP